MSLSKTDSTYSIEFDKGTSRKGDFLDKGLQRDL